MTHLLEAHPVRSARQLKGWSSTELAHRAGIAQSTVVRIENGDVAPSVEVVAALARALGLKDLHKLLGPWVRRTA